MTLDTSTTNFPMCIHRKDNACQLNKSSKHNSDRLVSSSKVLQHLT